MSVLMAVSSCARHKGRPSASRLRSQKYTSTGGQQNNSTGVISATTDSTGASLTGGNGDHRETESESRSVTSVASCGIRPLPPGFQNGFSAGKRRQALCSPSGPISPVTSGFRFRQGIPLRQQKDGSQQDCATQHTEHCLPATLLLKKTGKRSADDGADRTRAVDQPRGG
jgi:hypothetical protein